MAKLSQKSLCRLIQLTVLIIVATLAANSRSFTHSDNNLHLYYFDVGQGNASLIKKGDFEILIDGGPDDKIISRLNEVLSWQDREIEAVVLTHPHSDHVYGLTKVFDGYKVDRVIYSNPEYDSAINKKFLDQIKNEGAVADVIANPREYLFGDNLKLDILFPLKSYENIKLKNVHEANVVSKIIYGDRSFLFPGDLEAPEEKILVDSGHDLKSDILLAGHHGSKTSSSQYFLNSVKPQTVVISDGKNNDYGHPHKEVLKRYEADGFEVLRTDQEGSFHFETDGQMLERVNYP